MKHEHCIKGDDILLRPLEESDLEILRSWRNKEEIRGWFLNNQIINKEQQLRWFEKYMNNQNDMMFIIEYAVLNLPIGAIALYHIDTTRNIAEFGRLMIGEECARGKSLGLKATILLCDFAFSSLNLDELYLEVISNNWPAVSTYKKAGFKIICSYQNKDMELYKMNILRPIE